MVLRSPDLELAIAGFGAAVSRVRAPFRRPFVVCSRRRSSSNSSSAAAAVESIVDSGSVPASLPSSSRLPKPNGKGSDRLQELQWKTLSSKELGIKNSMITKPTRLVLNGLRKKGYDVYLVGGCVRDLVLKRTPKDFDIITTADLHEVKKTFSHCEIVGKRFPICHVHVHNSVVEVSSFNTYARKQSVTFNDFPTRPDCNKDDYFRWKNCLRRDFTINGLLFNPYSNVVYDYLGGMEDIKKAKVQTVIPAQASFQEDCARILRAIRIAARLGFRFSRETSQSVKDLGSSVLRLDKGRILMEMNYMLAFGSAESSLRLLWEFGLLELLLPIQAAYFVSQGFRRRDSRTNMLLTLFSNLDSLVSPNRPCHSSLWIGLLAFHQALVRQPRDPLVVATFTLSIHNGGNLLEAVDIARGISFAHNDNFPELLDPQIWDDDEKLVNEVLDLTSSVHSALSSMTDENYVSQFMAPYSDLVFIPLHLYIKVCRMLDCVRHRDSERVCAAKKGSQINYFNLSTGTLPEIRHVLARVVFDTVYPPEQEKQDLDTPA